MSGKEGKRNPRLQAVATVVARPIRMLEFIIAGIHTVIHTHARTHAHTHTHTVRVVHTCSIDIEYKLPLRLKLAVVPPSSSVQTTSELCRGVELCWSLAVQQRRALSAWI